ncbi:hypothetical protein HOY34_16250 [Xinfangfangia sp. D13-10-4-6]|uniref:hypothetical protein n=1 Tax=Pseudogemmobacter hezensis TaxID=2737662 RepID=UPI001555B723|nr:hypothetical protein [Pseudogemmobacter hezensis]NPD16744.1 hypothetical protein [Pseudogemmobacter hezensis]
MQEKPGDSAAQELLTLIRQLYAESGPVLRTRLSVVGRGRGLDVARLLIGLKAAGQIEEYEKKPGWIGWLLGKRNQMVLRPLGAAEEHVAPEPELAPGNLAPGNLAAGNAVQERGEVPVGQFEPAPPETAPEARDAAETVAEVDAESVAAPVVSAPEPELSAEPEPELTQMAPAVPVPELPVHEVPVPELAVPEVPAPVAAPQASVMAAPAVAAEPIRAPDPVSVAVPTRPRPVPVGYADDIGGVPIALQPAQLHASLDPDLLEGVRDFLVTLGIELTHAGEMLLADRMGRGAAAGDALMQVVLFGFAHMARFDVISDSPADPAELRDYTHSVLTELERLRDAGEISDDRFAQDRDEILTLSDSTADRAALIDRLFMDPVGGMAPPALLPAELRGVEEFEEDDILI